MFDTLRNPAVSFALSGVWILPLYAVWIAGIALMIRDRQRTPRRARLVIAGLAVQLVQSLVFVVIHLAIPAVAYRRGSVEQVASMLALVGALQHIANTVGWGLVIAGLVCRERPVEMLWGGVRPSSTEPAPPHR
jgi:hypothetical protein